MARPSTSVVLATFNGERFLEAQLASLADQDELPGEVVIVDDCSTDGSVVLVQAFARSAPFPIVHHVNPARLGYRPNFMRAAALAGGELIFFCDQDDLWFSNKIKRVVDQFAANPGTLLVYHNAALIDAAGERIGPLFPEGDAHARRAGTPDDPWFFAPGLVQAFRRELRVCDDLWPRSLEHFASDPLAHDRWYLMIAAALGLCRFLDEELLGYRQHGSNAFGAVAPPGLRERWRRRLHVDLAAARQVADGARSRGDVLAEMARRGALPGTAALAHAARRYRMFGDRLSGRLTTFERRGRLRRLAELAAAFTRGDYGRDTWHLQWASAPRDAAICLLGAR